MSTATFKVRGKLDGAGGDKDGTLTINRETGVVIVRPKGRRATYETTLGKIATYVCLNGFRNESSKSEDGEG